MLVKKKKGIVSLILAATMVLQVCAGTFSVARNAVAEEAGSEISSELVIYKKGEKNEKLPGVTFKLNSKTSGYSQEKISDSDDGKIVFDNLKPGDYMLTETNTPEDYEKIKTSWNVHVDDKGAVSINNKPANQLKGEAKKKYFKEGLGDWPGKPDTVEKSYKSLNNDKARNPEPYKTTIDEGALSKRISEVVDDPSNKYEIELTVEGKTKREIVPAEPVDVVVILDNSNSMNNSEPNVASEESHRNQHRAEKAKEAVQNLIDRVIRDNPANRVATVVYGSEIFDGGRKKALKGFEEKTGVSYEGNIKPTDTIKENREIYEENVPDYSTLTLTNVTTEVEEMKKKIPGEAAQARGLKKGDPDYIKSKFGATFTMAAFMEADKIFKKSTEPNRKKIIFHVTDGVPTRSYMPRFNHNSGGGSYYNQLLAMEKRGSLTMNEFVTADTAMHPEWVKGNGEGWFIYPKDAKSYSTFDNGKALGTYTHLAINTQEFIDETGKKHPSGYPITNHGWPTEYYIKSLKPSYEIFNIGVSLEEAKYTINSPPYWDSSLGSYTGGGETWKTLDLKQATDFMKEISSGDDHFIPVQETSDAKNLIDEALKNQFKKAIKAEDSIVDGVVEDPMGNQIKIDLGDDRNFDPKDYTLVAYERKEANSNYEEVDRFVEGKSNTNKLLKNARIEFLPDPSNPQGGTIKIHGVNLGENQKIELKYNVFLKDDFKNSTFYRTNKRTTLAPKGKKLDDKRDFPIPAIRDTRVYSYEITNKLKPKKYEVKFNKKNRLGEPLSGVGFKLEKELQLYPGIFTNYYSDGREIKSKQTGEVTLSELDKGTYQLRETHTLPNYEIPKNPIVAKFTIDNSGVHIDGGKTDIINYEKKTGKFTINKRDEKDASLDGANFKLSKKTTYGGDQQLPEAYQVKEEFRDKEQTTKGGKVDFNNLPPGTYDLVETKSPDGYIKDTRKFVVVVQNDGKTYLVDASKYNPNEYPLTGVINKPNLDIDLVKPEREPKSLDGEINVLDYSLYKNPTVNESRDERTIDPSLYESMWMKFKLVFPEDVKPKDTFTIKLDDEVDMKGFSVNHKIQKDIVAEDGNTVIAKHVDTKLDGKSWIFTYQMQDAVKDKYGIAVEMQRPIFVNPDVVGNEQNIAVANIIAGKSMEVKYFDVKYTKDDILDYFSNRVGMNMYKNQSNDTVDIYSYVVINDNSANNKKFTLQGSNLNFTNVDVKVYEVSKPQNYYADVFLGMPKSYGPKLMNLTNPVNKTVVEKEYYNLSVDLGNQHKDKAYIIKVTAKTIDPVSRISATASLQNQSQYSREIGAVEGNNTAVAYSLNKITLQKKDDQGLPLIGAKFKLSSAEGSTAGYEQVRTTGKDGKLEFGSLKSGRYYLEEEEAPFGYEKDSTKYKLFVETQENNKRITIEEPTDNTNRLLEVRNDALNLVAKNEKKPYSPPEITLKNYKNEITFHKGDDRGNVKEATFKLFKDSTEVDGQEKTESEIKYEKLSPGSYTVKETQAPEGFSAPADQIVATFTVTDDGTITDVKTYNGTGLEVPKDSANNIVNKKSTAKGKFTLRKTDEKQGFLEGATFTLSKKKGENLPSFFADRNIEVNSADGVEVKDLPIGLYTLTETKSPNGYKASGDHIVIVHASGNTQVIGKKLFEQLDKEYLKEKNDPPELFNILDIDSKREAKLLNNITVSDYELVSSNSKEPGVVRPNSGEYLKVKFKVEIPADAREGDYFYTRFDEKLNRLGNKMLEDEISPIKSYLGDELVAISNKNGDNTYKYILTKAVNNKHDFEMEIEVPLYINRKVVKNNSVEDIVNYIPSTGKDTEEAKKAEEKNHKTSSMRIEYGEYAKRSQLYDDNIGSVIYYNTNKVELDESTGKAKLDVNEDKIPVPEDKQQPYIESYIYAYGSKNANDKLSVQIYSKYANEPSAVDLFDINNKPTFEVYRVDNPFIDVDGTYYKLNGDKVPESFGIDKTILSENNKIETFNAEPVIDRNYRPSYWNLEINDKVNDTQGVNPYGYIIKVRANYKKETSTPIRLTATMFRNNHFSTGFKNEVVQAAPSATIRSANSIKLVKTDISGKANIPNAIFKLTSVEGEAKYSQYAKTNGDGSLFFYKIKKGEYILEEVVTPSGYEKPDSGWKISIDYDYGKNRYYIDKNKSTFEDGKKLLSLENSNEPYKSYIDTVEIHVKNNKSSENNTTRTVVNYPNRIKFYKVNENGLPLQGAKFELRSVTYSESQPNGFPKVAEIKQDNKTGEFGFEKLPTGSYELYEIKAPDDYPSVGEGVVAARFGVDEKGNIINVKTLALNRSLEEVRGAYRIFNNKININLKIVKRDNDDGGLLLGGAKFEVYKTNNVNTKPDKNTPKFDINEKKLWETALIDGSEKGTVTIEGLLDGVYWLKETKAPEGYIPYTDFIGPIQIKGGKVVTTGTETDNLSLSIENEGKNDQLNVATVTNSKNNYPLTGGIGTLIFYVIGTSLMLAVFILNKRGLLFDSLD